MIQNTLKWTTKSDLSDVTLPEVLEESGVTTKQYDNKLKCVRKEVSKLYKRKPREEKVGPYNTVILKLLKSNMNVQAIKGVYAMLTYLTL